MNDDKQPGVGFGEYAIMPDESDNDPCGKIGEGCTEVPRDDPRRIQKAHALHVGGYEAGALGGYGARKLI